MRIPTTIALVLLASIAWVFSWGQNGHRIVAEIAQRHLSPAASKAIEKILAGRRLADIANEPDDWRSDPRWACASTFHYVTVPADSIYPDATFADWKKGDAVRSVYYLAEVLVDQSASLEDKAIALAFLVHFVGDLHQPLHVGRGCDQGGNALSVTWMGDETNLHSVWDHGIIDSERLSYSEYTESLDRASEPLRHEIEVAPPSQWITDAQSHFDQIYKCSVRDRCGCFCGDCEDGLSVFGGCLNVANCQLQVANKINLGYNYRFRNKPVIDLQLLRGGLRLGYLLESLFTHHRLPDSYRDLGDRIEALDGWDTAIDACFTGPTD